MTRLDSTRLDSGLGNQRAEGEGSSLLHACLTMGVSVRSRTGSSLRFSSLLFCVALGFSIEHLSVALGFVALALANANDFGAMSTW